MSKRQNQDAMEARKTRRKTQEETIQAQDEVFKNGALLSKILSFLDAKEIKDVRQVNKSWANEGARHLVDNCFLAMPIAMRRRPSLRPNAEQELFTSFISCRVTETSNVSSIKITATTEFISWKSLGVIGIKVNAVKLGMVQNEASLFSALLAELPNLHYLNLDELDFNQNGPGLIQAITSSLNNIGRTTKLKISFMLLRPTNAQELENIDLFSTMPLISIETLFVDIHPAIFVNFPNFSARVLGIVQRLLQKNKQVLKHICFDVCQVFLRDLVFPVLESVEHMALKGYHTLLRRLEFHPSFQFATAVPKLKTMGLTTRGNGLGFVQFANMFGLTGTSLSVTNLEADVVNSASIVRLFEVFPNTEQFTANMNQSSLRMFDALWTSGGNLKALTIKMDLDLFFGGDFDLESFLTGFEPCTIEMLRKYPDWIKKGGQNLEEIRVRSSILDLKGLETVVIVFTGGFVNVMPGRMLAVAGVHAFQLMAKRTKITIDVRNFNISADDAAILFHEVSQISNVSVLAL